MVFDWPRGRWYRSLKLRSPNVTPLEGGQGSCRSLSSCVARSAVHLPIGLTSNHRMTRLHRAASYATDGEDGIFVFGFSTSRWRLETVYLPISAKKDWNLGNYTHGLPSRTEKPPQTLQSSVNYDPSAPQNEPLGSRCRQEAYTG